MVKTEVKERMREFVKREFDSKGYDVSRDCVDIDCSVGLYLFGEGKLGALMLVYDDISGDKFKQLKSHAVSQKPNTSFVFLKDGKTFFRSWARESQYKRALGLSLAQYDSQEVAKAILLTPAEQSVLGLQRNKIQYYQPNSTNLCEGIVTYQFEPFRLDYSHIDSAERFKPENRESKRLFKNSPLENHVLLINSRSR